MSGRPNTSKTTGQPIEAKADSTQQKREPRVLIVDADKPAHQTLDACAMQGEPMMVFHAHTLADAHQALVSHGPMDLVLVSQTLPDGDGLSLVDAIAQGKRVIQTVLLADNADATLAIDAMRRGVCDLLPLPLDLEETNTRVRAALAKQAKTKAPYKRARRLRKLCRKLNDARLDVSQQVDILCNDLVTAYQELAEQMEQVAASSEYGALIKNELDLESALRTTLEFIVSKAGPSNAAIFLPATMDEYSVGGYVNFDCPGDSVDMLLDHLADVVAPLMNERDDIEHITNDAQMHQWIGDDACYLADQELIAIAARHDGEALAVITLFRDREQPFDRATLDACGSVGPILGEALARIIRVHHRHLPDIPLEDDLLQGPDAPWDGGGDDGSPF